jgi:hypothetical protein
MSPKGVRITKVVVVVAAMFFLGLFGLYVRDARRTNAFVSKLRAYEPGTVFADVVTAHGPPDRMDAVDQAWKWGRRMVRVPPEVKHIAVYNRQIAPQVCTFWLDENDRIVAVEVFAGY